MFQQRAIRGDASWLEREPSDFQQMTAEIMNTGPRLVAGSFGYSGAWVTGPLRLTIKSRM